MFDVLFRVFCQTCDQGRFRMVHYSVQGTHLHLIVEASDRASMTRGMQRIGIRIALGLNKAMGRPRGRVLGDRYHEHHLESPREVRNALGYVLNNFRKHNPKRCDAGWTDPLSSADFFTGWKGDAPPRQHGPAVPIAPARTWLLCKGWRRGGLLSCDMLPE